MRNETSAAGAVTAFLGEKDSDVGLGIQFDDERFTSEERKLEAARQVIWEKLLARLRTEFPAMRE